jgi:hypothetical protein
MLSFVATAIVLNFTASNTVVNGTQRLGGLYRSRSRDHDHVYQPGSFFRRQLLFRPEVEVINGDFLYLSAPRPILRRGRRSPAIISLIRNSNLAPDYSVSERTSSAAHRPPST